ncbi:hypothetical protein PCANC_25666 [Puccinia coronata f. sp. avenae]|uniref:Uncharacterized protein n=1 Tax=Puccinia coronata f. sp. avenae TaxID=200324 RepID=A0A2N5SE41_9BASI|nr:hypothetical protein PCANC_25666 [Puccinia coronata f. sp. avenae]
MAASELTLDAAIQFELGRRATDLIENQLKHGRKTPGPLSLNWLSNELVAWRPSLNRTAASNVNLDAAIQCSFAGSALVLLGALPEKLAWMAASEFLSDAAIRFKLRCAPPSELVTHSNSAARAFGHRV